MVWFSGPVCGHCKHLTRNGLYPFLRLSGLWVISLLNNNGKSTFRSLRKHAQTVRKSKKSWTF